MSVHSFLLFFSHCFVEKYTFMLRKQFQSFHGPQSVSQGASLDHQAGSTGGTKHKSYF